MFKIYDGRDKFYQWDLDRKLIVEDASITEVHFCNRTEECALPVATYKEDGKTLVNVPNILLQDSWRINVYAYDDKYTKHAERFDVVARSKPDDYVYTETEIKSWEELAERVEQIEQNGISDAAVEQAVEKYLEENDINVDLTGYATEQYVQDEIAKIPETDLTGYATEKFVQDEIAKIDIPETDLSDYATKKYVDDAVKDVDVDLTGYATEQYVQEQIEQIEIPEATGGKEEVYVGTEEPTDSEALIWINPDGESSGELATKAYVDEQIAASMPEVPDVNLSNYYTKQETQEYVTNSLKSYVTAEQLNNKSYQTANDVTAAINSALGAIGIAEEGTF